MAKKELGPESYWAQYIVRTHSAGKDYLYALVRRRYSEEDIERDGTGKYIGVTEEERFPMVTDADPDSDTFGKRIQQEGKESNGKKLKYTLEFNEKNIRDMKTMCGAIGDPFGETRFIWKFKERAISTDNVSNFWELDWEEAHKRFIERSKQVIEIEQSIKQKQRSEAPKEKPKQVIKVEQKNINDNRHRDTKKAG
jgi:hypothetical protein